MYAISLWQPHAWAITRGKNFENRSWSPPARLLGETIAIHAAARFKEREEREVVEQWKGLRLRVPPAVGSLQRGAVVAVARLCGWAKFDTEGMLVEVRACDNRVYSRIADTASLSPYASGPYAWYLERRRGLRYSIRCRGYQRLWCLPPSVEGLVLQQIAWYLGGSRV